MFTRVGSRRKIFRRWVWLRDWRSARNKCALISHTYTHMHTHAHAHTHMHTHTCTHMHARTCIHTHTHTHTHIHAHSHTHKHTHTRTDDSHRVIRGSEHERSVRSHHSWRRQYKAYLPEQKGVCGEGSTFQAS